MLTKEMKKLFMNQAFEYKKGKFVFKTNFLKGLHRVYSPSGYTADERVLIAYDILSKYLDEYEPKTSWKDISSNSEHEEWKHLLSQTFLRARGEILKKKKGIDYRLFEDYEYETFYTKDYIHSIPDSVIWAKANKEDVLSRIQLKLYKDLVEIRYPEDNWTLRYAELNPDKKSRPSKQIKNLKKTMNEAWQSVKDSKSVKKDFLAFLDFFLDLDPQEMKETIHYHVEEYTTFASLILYKLPIEEVIEINLYCQGKGDIEKDTLYQIGNIVMDYIESEEDSPHEAV